MPVSTAAATASTDAVRIGNAPMTTETIVAAKIANRCHAWAVSPSGGGMNQMASATATIAAGATMRPRSRRFRSSRASEPEPSVQIDRTPLHHVVVAATTYCHVSS